MGFRWQGRERRGDQRHAWTISFIVAGLDSDSSTQSIYPVRDILSISVRMVSCM